MGARICELFQTILNEIKSAPWRWKRKPWEEEERRSRPDADVDPNNFRGPHPPPRPARAARSDKPFQVR